MIPRPRDASSIFLIDFGLSPIVFKNSYKSVYRPCVDDKSLIVQI